MTKFAAERECQGIICGHIHTPADRRIGDVHYLNSGDWVESMTAIVETMGRGMELISYKEFRAEIDRIAAVRPSKFSRPGKPTFPETDAPPPLRR